MLHAATESTSTSASCTPSELHAADTAASRKPVIGYPSHPFADLKYHTPLMLDRPTGRDATTAALYAFVSILFVLGGAAAGVLQVGLQIWRMLLSTLEALALVLLLLFFSLVGFFGFHRSWAPVTARRCFLAGHAASARPCSCGAIATVLLAPVFAMGYFFAPRRRLLISYALAACIASLVVLVEHLPPPWHQLVDCGVALALCLGTAARRKSACPCPLFGQWTRPAPSAALGAPLNACSLSVQQARSPSARTLGAACAAAARCRRTSMLRGPCAACRF